MVAPPIFNFQRPDSKLRSNVQYDMVPYRWFRYTLLVPTVAWVHFLHLKPLVCIPISTGPTWDIGTKNRYVIPQGFGSQMCTLRIPTICTINTVMKVVSRIKKWRDSRANNGPILKGRSVKTTHIQESCFVSTHEKTPILS
jgi:hypothetical protein